MPAALPDLYTIDDLVERYPRLSRDTLYDLLGSGELRGFRLTPGKRAPWYVDPDDWRDFIERRKASGREVDDGADDAPPAPSRRRRGAA